MTIHHSNKSHILVSWCFWRLFKYIFVWKTETHTNLARKRYTSTTQPSCKNSGKRLRRTDDRSLCLMHTLKHGLRCTSGFWFFSAETCRCYCCVFFWLYTFYRHSLSFFQTRNWREHCVMFTRFRIRVSISHFTRALFVFVLKRETAFFFSRRV